MDEMKKEEALEQAQAPAQEEEKEPYTPRPVGIRILAWVLAILLTIGLILYYYNIFTAG